MKNLKSKLIILVIAISLISCSKDDKTKDCETNNFGTVKVNFTDLSEKHAIDATRNGTSDLESEIVNAGVASGSIQLQPGTYTINVTQVNDAGQALGDAETYINREVNQCETLIINSTN